MGTRRGFLGGLFGSGLVLPFTGKRYGKPEPAETKNVQKEVVNQYMSFSCSGSSYYGGEYFTVSESFGHHFIKK